MGMGAKSEILGELVAPGGKWLYPENHRGRTPFAAPGIAIGNDGHYYAVKAPTFRPDRTDRSEPGVFTGDLVPLVNAVGKREKTLPTNRHAGIEIETNVVTSDGEAYDLYPNTDDDPLIPHLRGHPELYRNTAEVVGEPRETITDAYDSALGSVATLMRDLIELGDGAMIDPASARMHDVPTEKDITPNKYVRVMCEIMGPNVVKFIGTGIHEHHELHVGVAPAVASRLRILAPFLNLGLQAAPHAFGELNPRLGEILDNDELRQFDGVQPQSVRYPTRAIVSKDGGVGLSVAHDSMEEALRFADRRLTEGHISNPSRLYGPHADVRIRFDAPGPEQKDHPGRIELCVKDTSALRRETLVAYGELTRAVIERLERAVLDGERGIAMLHKNFPKLFGPSYDTEQLASKQIPRAHENALQIAYYGSDAKITNGLGETVIARQHFEEVLRFATSSGTLPAWTVNILRRSLAPFTDIEAAARQYKDENGLPSLRGYYETGLGTPAQWMIARAAGARAIGLSEREAMRTGTIDRAQSFQIYLSGDKR